MGQTLSSPAAMMPPSPFLDGRDLEARSASQIRKLSNAPSLADGDTAFYGVNTFLPPHELPPGTAADAVNKRFEDGRAWPRFGVAQQPWGFGAPGGNLIPAAAAYNNVGVYEQRVCAGARYRLSSLAAGNQLTVDSVVYQGGGDIEFVCVSGLIHMENESSGPGLVAPATLRYVSQTPCAFVRFNDPQGMDTLVLVTNDWRTGAGEDGGRGRAWRLSSGAGPVEISLNGHDVWGTCRLIPCHNGLLLLRQGDERHYFGAAAVGTNDIQLNAAPNWSDGDQVFLFLDAQNTFTFTGVPPATPVQTYYVKTDRATNKVTLYSDAALTTQITWSGAAGTQFYIERRALFPGFYGNGAPPLLAQPTASGGQTLWDNGFKAVPADVAVTSTNKDTGIVTAPNHRLVPGDYVTVSGVHTTGNATIPQAYVYPTSPDTLRLYTSQLDALGNSGNNTITLVANNETGSVRKSGASALPIPPGREGCYFQNRSVLVNGRDTILVSDALDPLHYAPLQAAFTANLGESDLIMSITPFGPDSLVIEKENGIFLWGNFSAGPAGWTLTAITREYGQTAALSGAQVGVDFWALSRKGVQSVTQTVQGIVQGVADPVSKPMQKYINQIDWRYAAQACGAYWNNRYLLAVPLKGQSGTPVNNGVLVYNFLNQQWEGLWRGTALQVYAWARHLVYGEERLCFVSPAGQVGWLTDGYTDTVNGTAAAIADSLTTRRYAAGNTLRKLWLAAVVQWDTIAPSLTVTAQAPGVNQVQTLLPSPVTYDRTASFMAARAPYDPAHPTPAKWGAADRQDYSLTPAELTSGRLDTHQNVTEPFRLRLDGWGVQVVIANAAGSARIQAVSVRGVQTLGIERQKA